MSRYIGPRRKLIRRLDDLPGFTTKRRKKNEKTPGQHGKTLKFFQSKLSAYGVRLVEKQKLRFNYHLTEKQLVRYVNQAKKSPESAGEALLSLLEMRLDNIVFRLGLAPTIIAARQLVCHGHITVNDKKVNIASYGCSKNDVISVRSNNKSKKLVQQFLEKTQSLSIPSHLKFNESALMATVNRKANRQSVLLQINELLVIEYYAGK